MELRQLRYFLAVAEELHFARAAARVGIEQAPLSRAIKAFQSALGVKLFETTTRSTRLTWPGEVLLGDARRILAAVDHARQNLSEAAAGRRQQFRVGLCDGIAHPRLSQILARWRTEEPEVELRLLDGRFAQQVEDLKSGFLDVGLALAPSNEDGVHTEPVWTDPISAAVHAAHPLAGKMHLPLIDIVREPLVLYTPECDCGAFTQLESLIYSTNDKPHVADRVASVSGLLTLVGAGYGIGFISATQAETIRRTDVVIRPLSGSGSETELTTYILWRYGESSQLVTRFRDFAKEVVCVTGPWPQCPSS